MGPGLEEAAQITKSLRCQCTASQDYDLMSYEMRHMFFVCGLSYKQDAMKSKNGINLIMETMKIDCSE